MRTTQHRADLYRPTNAPDHPPPVAASLALAVALPLAVYLLAHPVTAVFVVLTAATTAAVVGRTPR